MAKNQYNTSKLVSAISPVKNYYRLMLRGKKVRCNVCGHTYKKFRQNRLVFRQNALCPNCNSLEWTRVLWFYLRNEVLGKKNKKHFLYFKPEKNLVEKLNEFNIQLDVVEMNYWHRFAEEVVQNKLPRGEFDVILLPHVIQYVNDDQLVYEELNRLLRPGGFALTITIINWEMERTYENPETAEDKDRLKDYFEPGVKRVYGSDYRKHLSKAGFEVEVIDYADQLGSAARDYYRLGNGAREMIFKCKKKVKKS